MTQKFKFHVLSRMGAAYIYSTLNKFTTAHCTEAFTVLKGFVTNF